MQALLLISGIKGICPSCNGKDSGLGAADDSGKIAQELHNNTPFA